MGHWNRLIHQRRPVPRGCEGYQSCVSSALCGRRASCSSAIVLRGQGGQLVSVSVNVSITMYLSLVPERYGEDDIVQSASPDPAMSWGFVWESADQGGVVAYTTLE